MADRRFPPPWSVEELGECFVVHDHSGQKLAYVYFEEEPDDDQWRNCSVGMKRDACCQRGKVTRAIAQALAHRRGP
jgi:hypothetical protein